MPRATLAVVLLGVVARLTQWLGDPSLWFDELQLVRNLTERGLVELVTGGLDYGQVAPVGWLLLTKSVMLVFGDGELALRLVPFCASVAALVLFHRLASRLLRPTGAFVATAAFALNPLLISLSAVTKQYSTDVFAAVLILLAVPRLWDATAPLRSRTLLAVGVGALSFFSIPSVTAAAAAIAAVLYRLWRSGALRDRNDRLDVLMPVAAWATTAGAGALLARVTLDPGMQDFMVDFWTSRSAFAPPFSEYPTWLFEYGRTTLLPGLFSRPYFGRASDLEGLLLPFMAYWVLAAAVVGSGVVWVRAQGLAWAMAVFLPLVLCVGLSRLEIYPLHPRTVALVIPFLIILGAATVDELARAVSQTRVWPRVAIAAAALIPMVAILVDQPPLYEVQQTREVIAELSRRRAPQEPVFAHPWAASALAYYGRRFAVEDGVHVGRQGNVEETLEELERYRGVPSLWVLFTLAEDRETYVCYLNEVGKEIESLELDNGRYVNPVSIHRYDLSDESRWESPARSGCL